jgi:L-lactate dehydrogenase complex protein LldG
MSSRETILQRLRAPNHTAEMPGRWESSRRYEDMAGQYKRMVEAVYGEVYLTGSLGAALTQLEQILAALETKRVAMNTEPPLDGLGLPDRFPGIEWFTAGQSKGDLRQFCVSADAGITSAEWLIAETGTLVISSGAGRSRLVSLLSPVHITLVPSSRLLPDIFAWQEKQRGGDWPANRVFISGPSKTADIEQTMTVGVHGPTRFIVILYGE